jgi:hypothetical protein
VGDTPSDLLNAVVRRMEAERPRPAPRQLEARAGRIRDLLRGVEPDTLSLAGAALEVDLAELGAEPSAWKDPLFLAVQLMSAKLVPAAGKALYALIDRFPVTERESRRRQLIDLVASAWVDYDSAEIIPSVVKRQTTARALCLGVSLPDTARLYITCARADGEGPWSVAPCSAVFGERAADDAVALSTPDLMRAIRAALIHSLTSSEAELDFDLETEESYGAPVIVILPRAGISKEVFAELREAFRTVTFLFLRGDRPKEALPPLADDEVKFLVPAVPALHEQRFQEEHTKFRRFLRPRDETGVQS